MIWTRRSRRLGTLWTPPQWTIPTARFTYLIWESPCTPGLSAEATPPTWTPPLKSRGRPWTSPQWTIPTARYTYLIWGIALHTRFERERQHRRPGRLH